jgi:hypothetical protein
MFLFVWGTMTFKKITSGNPWYPLSHGAGLWLIGALGLWGLLAHPASLAFAVAGTSIFALIGLWEWVSFHGGWLEPMEARGWWLGKILRRRIERVRARRETREAGAREPLG